MADWYGTFSGDSRYRLHVQAYESATYVATNESDVVVKAWIEKLSGGGYFTSNTNATASCTVNAVSVSVSNWSPYDFSSYTSKLILSTTRRILHNADGSKSVVIAMSANDPNNFGTASIGTPSLPLTTLPRASVPTLSAATVDAGGTVTINTNRLSTSFTHDIEYDFVSLTGQTTGLALATGVTTSTTLTPPTSILSQIPNATSGTLVVRVTTFNGATQIGSPQTVNLTVTVPVAAVPTIGSLTVTEGTVVPDVATLIGQFVQNVSKVSATTKTGSPPTTPSVQGIYGSTIVSTKITVNGQTITGESGTTVNPISASGTLAVVAETTDSRGRVGTLSQNITVLPYVAPQATTAEARRALVAGTVDQSAGTYIRVDMTAVVQSLINGSQKNDLHYRISTSPAGANTWTVRVAATNAGASTLAFDSYSGSNPYILLTAGAPYPVTDPFDVKIEIIDKLGITTVVRTVAQGALLADWNAGLGLGLGAYHQGLGRLETTGGGGIYQDGYPVVDFSDAATTSLPGISELATSAETITGTDATRTVTPAGLAALTADTTRKGLIEIATLAEALALTDTTRAVTPAALADLNAWYNCIPTAIASSGATATYDSVTGTVTLPAGCTAVRLDGLFAATGFEYEILLDLLVQSGNASTNSAFLRMSEGGTVNSSAAYQMGGTMTAFDGTTAAYNTNGGTIGAVGYVSGAATYVAFVSTIRLRPTAISGSTGKAMFYSFQAMTQSSARGSVGSGYTPGATSSFDGIAFYFNSALTGLAQGKIHIKKRVVA